MKKIVVTRRALIWWIASIAWIILAVYLSVQNGDDSALLSDGIASTSFEFLRRIFPGLRYVRFSLLVRKLAHFAVHAVLAFALYRASINSSRHRRKGAALALTLVIALLVALIDELIQLEAPGRYSTATDAGINVFGVFAGTFISSIIP
ncbi:VanZ family protein [Candidatus Saccharibacteria bacterium]|nr:VanZ family protein [Candidatus Saccharibacteria bacterium]